MRATAVWIVVEPGAGKTCIARALLDGRAPFVNGRVKWTVGPRVCAAGTYTGGAFDGADTVPYDGARPCLEFWRDALAGRAAITLFDGDRFSNASALKFMREQPGVQLVCVYVTCTDAAGRRARRSSSVQNATWVKGRATKAKNFYDRFPGHRLEIASDGVSAEALADSVRAFLVSL